MIGLWARVLTLILDQGTLISAANASPAHLVAGCLICTAVPTCASLLVDTCVEDACVFAGTPAFQGGAPSSIISCAWIKATSLPACRINLEVIKK